ncbi:MAG: N4-gp56 family major capsid protein [Ktedonobacteraceae bacterium]
MAGTVYADLITTNALPDAMRVVFSNELEFTSRPTLVFDQTAWVEERDDFSAKKGQTVIWTVYHQLAPAITPLSENTDVDSGSIQDHQVSFQVHEYGASQGTTEALDLLSYHGPVSNIVRSLLAPQQALSFDTICRNMFWYANNRTLTDPTAVGAAYKLYTGNVNSRAALNPTTSVMTSEIARAVAYHMSIRRVPTMEGQEPSYVCITHPSVTYDLRSDPYWKDAQLYSGATRIFNGEEGMIHGVRFIKSDRARVANGGNLVVAAGDGGQQALLSPGLAAGSNSCQVASVTGFAVGQEVTLHHAGVNTTQGGNTWTAPDGQDGTSEELIIKQITGAGPYTVTFTQKATLNHATNDFMTEALDVYPMTVLGGLAPMGRGMVVPPEVRVSLPTDKLRRMSYVGWYALMGYGIIRETAYEIVETLASVNTPPPYSF